MAGETWKSPSAGHPVRLKDLEEACREKGFRLTPQRRAVLRTLVESGDHPAAEQLYLRVHGSLPDLSRATVFRILEHLVAGGIISKASHPGRSARYDVRTELHHHLLCLRCESMVDIYDDELNKLPIPDTSTYSFDIVDFRVQLRGYCRGCRQSMRKENAR